MSYGNYGGNRQQQRPKPQLPQLAQEHDIDPVFKAIMNQADKLQPFNQSGEILPTEMIRFDTLDGQGVTVPVWKAMLVVQLSFAVDFENPAYPNATKLKTEQNRALVCPQYRERIAWKHSAEFWHIPGYTRYVINEKGHIKNAFNGMDIRPNQYGAYALMADTLWFLQTPHDKQVFGVQKWQIERMAFKALPDDYRDFGLGKVSHVFGFDKTTGTIDLVKRPAVVARSMSGQTVEAENLSFFSAIYATNKEVKEFKSARDFQLYEGPITIAGHTIKLKDESLISHPTPVQINQQGAAPAQPAMQPQAPQQQAWQSQSIDGDVPL